MSDNDAAARMVAVLPADGWHQVAPGSFQTIPITLDGGCGMNRAQHLSVDAGNVVAVLLADGWHKVASGSFMVGPMGFGDGGGMIGYRFEEIDDASPYGPVTLAGPLEALLAIRQARPAAMCRSDRYKERLRAIDGLRTLASS